MRKTTKHIDGYLAMGDELGWMFLNDKVATKILGNVPST